MTDFQLMTWNVENLFRPALGADQEEMDRYAAKLSLLARIIAHHGPDVVGLQEVGGDDELADVQTELGSLLSLRFNGSDHHAASRS